MLLFGESGAFGIVLATDWSGAAKAAACVVLRLLHDLFGP